VYRNLAPTQDGHLHVYIEGDGTPYSRPTAVAADPTPRNPLMLRLMAQDDAASVYLGRPCYFDPIHDPVCRPRFWTIARYGPQVLDSMEAVVRSEAVRSGAVREDIFGLSGGGSIAVLLAQRLDTVTRVVTIGANLDLDAWCELHRYSPLAESINPAAQHPARANLEVLHLVGEHDLNTPPFLVQAAARARGGERVQVVEHFDHVCCWEVLWRDILNGPP
jgi:pimeloyl-ACP methyl ester carboxylesterase